MCVGNALPGEHNTRGNICDPGWENRAYRLFKRIEKYRF